MQRLLLILLLLASGQHARPQPVPPVRVWGYDGMGSLLERWEAGYRELHPTVQFRNTLHGADSAMAGLYTGVADLSVMGREIYPVDTMAYRWVFQYPPFGIDVVTGGLASPGQSFTPVVAVNRQNPVAAISLAQLDGIYGSEHRRGGRNLRVWGDLGLTGAWADRPIHVYGYGVDDPLGIYFRKQVLRGDFKPNPASHLLTDRGARTSAAKRLAAIVTSDPLAIAYLAEPAAGQLKVLPVAPDADHAAQAPEPAAVAAGVYPLSRQLTLYVNRKPGEPVAEPLLSFLDFVLSDRGQQMVAEDGRYLPLPGPVLEAERRRLHAEFKLDKGAKGGPGASDDGN